MTRRQRLLVACLVVLSTFGTVGCAPPPSNRVSEPPPEAVTIVDAAWASYPELRQRILAQRHLVGAASPPFSVQAEETETASLSITVTWAPWVATFATSARSDERYEAATYSAAVGAMVLALIKWRDVSPPGWPAGPSAAGCAAQKILTWVLDGVLPECSPTQIDQAWAALTA